MAGGPFERESGMRAFRLACAAIVALAGCGTAPSGANDGERPGADPRAGSAAARDRGEIDRRLSSADYARRSYAAACAGRRPDNPRDPACLDRAFSGRRYLTRALEHHADDGSVQRALHACFLDHTRGDVTDYEAAGAGGGARGAAAGGGRGRARPY